MSSSRFKSSPCLRQDHPGYSTSPARQRSSNTLARIVRIQDRALRVLLYSNLVGREGAPHTPSYACVPCWAGPPPPHRSSSSSSSFFLTRPAVLPPYQPRLFFLLTHRRRSSSSPNAAVLPPHPLLPFFLPEAPASAAGPTAYRRHRHPAARAPTRHPALLKPPPLPVHRPLAIPSNPPPPSPATVPYPTPVNAGEPPHPQP
jgi:hypothetical protein